jgi:hypothetical protein
MVRTLRALKPFFLPFVRRPCSPFGRGMYFLGFFGGSEEDDAVGRCEVEVVIAPAQVCEPA